MRNYFISYLSGRKYGKTALYFALCLKMEEDKFPPDLKRFVDGNPGIVELTRSQVYK